MGRQLTAAFAEASERPLTLLRARDLERRCFEELVHAEFKMDGVACRLTEVCDTISQALSRHVLYCGIVFKSKSELKPCLSPCCFKPPPPRRASPRLTGS